MRPDDTSMTEVLPLEGDASLRRRFMVVGEPIRGNLRFGLTLELLDKLAEEAALAYVRRVDPSARVVTAAIDSIRVRRPADVGQDLSFLARLNYVGRSSMEVGIRVEQGDHFKPINDTWGHAAGDAFLQSVARTCRLELRGGDQIGRIGGEELLVVLHSATGQQAREIAERLRLAVERLDLSSVASEGAPDLRVTISLGVWVASEYDSSAAIAAADSLLYRAKDSGRNRVEMEAAAG